MARISWGRRSRPSDALLLETPSRVDPRQLALVDARMTAETGTQIQKLEKLLNAGVIMAGPTYNPVDL
jgi:hypothetical protein